MQFYDATNLTGICQEIDRLCDSTDSSYTRLDKTARANQALQTVETWIISADGTWQFDDSNYTDLPRGVGTLVEGQAQYSFASEYLDIIEVEIKDVNSIYRKIQPVDPSELGDLSWDQYFGITVSDGTPSKGFPRAYDKNADGIRLGPAPTSTAVTLAAGLRVTFQRKASLFTAASDTSADTTAPGFASPFHILIPYMASVPYCMAYKKDRVAALMQFIGDTPQPTGMKRELLAFYGRREKDKRKQLTAKRITFK